MIARTYREHGRQTQLRHLSVSPTQVPGQRPNTLRLQDKQERRLSPQHTE